jgi:hypothetical protein
MLCFGFIGNIGTYFYLSRGCASKIYHPGLARTGSAQSSHGFHQPKTRRPSAPLARTPLERPPVHVQAGPRFRRARVPRRRKEGRLSSVCRRFSFRSPSLLPRACAHGSLRSIQSTPRRRSIAFFLFTATALMSEMRSSRRDKATYLSHSQ